MVATKSFVLDDDQYAQFKILCISKKVSMSERVRYLIDYDLDNNKDLLGVNIDIGEEIEPDNF